MHSVWDEGGYKVWLESYIDICRAYTVHVKYATTFVIVLLLLTDTLREYVGTTFAPVQLIHIAVSNGSGGVWEICAKARIQRYNSIENKAARTEILKITFRNPTRNSHV